MVDYGAPGVPIWVDVSSPDMEKTKAFYEGLFGWEGNTGGPETGGYTIFTLDGKLVAGSGPAQDPKAVFWSTYFQTDDADATAEKVKAAGGQVQFGPMDVMDVGRMTVFQDPTGAHFCAWQPGTITGAEKVNEPGCFSWSELYTRDIPTDLEFYKQVFGYEVAETDMSQGKYYLFNVNGRSVAGGMDMATINLPAEIPPHWLVYFATSDIHDSMNKVKELGGQVMNGPIDTPMGPFAVTSDPFGGVFAIIQFQSQESQG